MNGIPEVPMLEDVQSVSRIIGTEKKCPKCQKIKSVEEFSLCKKIKDGLRSWCKKCECEQVQLWQKANPPKVREIKRQWVKANPERVRELHRKNKAKKYNTLKGKLIINIGNSVRSSLKNGKKGRHWENLLGFTVEQFKEHFEKQFNNGMNWNRFMKGEIHIDHIIPISVFNFEKPEDVDFKKAWDLKNLQPLWASENLKKGNKLSKPFQPNFIFG